MNTRHADTIAAIATPPGKGGVGIIRLSGPRSLELGAALSGRENLTPRKAHYARFRDEQNQSIDTGLVLFFAGPNSFTGEDVVEIQGHGGPVIQDMLLARLLAMGARQARAGEFSERAFLNDKLDLTQAEAIADLIESSTAQGARSAIRSLQGAFSERVNELLKELIYLRVFVEAAIDFPEEEIDFLADDKLRMQIQAVQDRLAETLKQAGQGRLLRTGLRIVLAGKPNAGKSSLLNALAGTDAAIVTDVPGTTRDTITQTIDLDGMPVQFIDTAGLRDSDDRVERIGIARARKEIAEADHIVYLQDATDPASEQELTELSEFGDKLTVVFNKVDLAQAPENVTAISAITGQGLDRLRTELKAIAGFEGASENLFSARRRHLTALQNAGEAVSRGWQQLQTHNAGELLAEELRLAQEALGEITGEFRADDLLGEIFSSFCIGK